MKFLRLQGREERRKFAEHTLVVGEWGGWYNQKQGQHGRWWGDGDVKWQKEFAQYMINRCITDNFYWALNHNSGDTGGLVAGGDWGQKVWDKINLANSVVKNPSKIYWSQGKVCTREGWFVNWKCKDPKQSVPYIKYP